MKYALQRCCATPVFLKQYETSTNEVLKRLDVSLVDIKEFGCCGYPLKSLDLKTSVLSSARNLSLAEKRNLNVMTFCNCCYGNLKHARKLIREDDALKKDVNRALRREGLECSGASEVRHLLEVLYRDIGIGRLREKISKRFSGVKVAVHYGCHILRPRQVVGFDDPGAAAMFDRLVEATGAETVDWRTKLQCCGSPMWGVNDELSMDLMEKKIRDAVQSGADCLCVACPYCQLQFDRVQRILISKRRAKLQLPSILYTQLLGLALECDARALGIESNELNVGWIKKHLVQDVSCRQSAISKKM